MTEHMTQAQQLAALMQSNRINHEQLTKDGSNVGLVLQEPLTNVLRGLREILTDVKVDRFGPMQGLALLTESNVCITLKMPDGSVYHG